MVLTGLLIPFAGTSLGAACLFFCAGYHEHQPAKSPDQLCRGRYGGRHGVELAHPCAGAICPTGAVVICSGGGRILARHSVSAGAGPRCAPYAPGQHRRRPHVNLKRTTMLVLAVTLHNIPEDIAVGVVNAGWVSGMVGITAAALVLAIQNFPEGAIISMPLWAEGQSKPHAFWYGVAFGVVEPIERAERTGGGVGNACSAVSAQLCRRCYDIRFGGRTCSGNGGG